MPASLADFVGTPGATFTLTIDSGYIAQAVLSPPGIPLQVSSGTTITVPDLPDQPGKPSQLHGLPSGDSSIVLSTVFAPGDQPANVKVGTVTSGKVTPNNPGTLDPTQAYNTIALFGKP